MKKAISKILFTILSVASLSSCAFFDVKYPTNSYSYSHVYAVGDNEGKTINTLTIERGQKQKIYPTIDGHKVPFDLKKWYVQEKEIASVDSHGVVKGLKAGTTYISVEFKDGVYGGLTVRVKPSEKDKQKSGLSKFFEMNGKRQPALVGDVILYNDYYFEKYEKEEIIYDQRTRLSCKLNYCDASYSERPFTFTVEGYVYEIYPETGEQISQKVKTIFKFVEGSFEDSELSILYGKYNPTDGVYATTIERLDCSYYYYDGETEHINLKKDVALPEPSQTINKLTEEEMRRTYSYINLAIDFFKTTRAEYGGTFRLFETE